MALLTLPNALPGDAFARAGLAMLRRLANAEALVDGVPVVGSLRATAQQPSLGGLLMQAATLDFDCITGDLPSGIREGDTLAVNGAAYRVAARVDQPELQQTTLTLERA